VVVIAANVEDVERRPLRRPQHTQVEGPREAVVVIRGDVVPAAPLDGGKEDA